ncbi:MAG: hypothetical protein ACC669_11270 [bacterium]
MKSARVFVIRVVFVAAILTILPLPGLLGPAQALNVDWKVNMRTISSDNFNRLSAGFEDTGTQFTLTSGLDLHWSPADSSYSIGGEVGSEWVDSNQDTRNLVYRLNTDLKFNRRSNHYVNVTANASRDTSIPEEDLLNRNRVREDRLTASIATGQRRASGTAGAATSWEIGLSREDTDRESTQSRSIKLDAMKTWESGPGGELRLSGSALRGDDKETDNIWKEGELSALFTQTLSRRIVRGANLSLSASKTEAQGGATLSRTDNLSLLFFRRSEISAVSRVGFSLGVDGLKTEGEGREWSGQAGLTLNSQLAKKLDFNLDSSASTRVFRNTDRTPAWSRTAQISMGLDLSFSRSRGVFTTTSYGKDNFPQGTAGMSPGLKRTDERFFGQLGYRERPSQEFELSVSLIVEKVHSNLWTADFKENRMELAASILF